LAVYKRILNLWKGVHIWKKHESLPVHYRSEVVMSNSEGEDKIVQNIIFIVNSGI